MPAAAGTSARRADDPGFRTAALEGRGAFAFCFTGLRARTEDGFARWDFFLDFEEGLDWGCTTFASS
jgi:hypothetical protein